MQNQTAGAISIEEAVKFTGIGRSKLYQAMASGELPSFKFGKRRLIRREAVSAWLARLEADSIATGPGLKAPAAG